MNTNQKIFLTIIIVGGLLVIGSYFLGFRSEKGTDVLWGGIPENSRSLYTVSMLVSATAYFIFITYIFKLLGSNTLQNTLLVNPTFYLIIFALILIASTLWIPLVNVMIANPSNLVWFGIRTVLAIVGLASLLLFISVLTISPRPNGIYYYSALIGILIFTIHTGILDAILWPYYWIR